MPKSRPSRRLTTALMPALMTGLAASLVLATGSAAQAEPETGTVRKASAATAVEGSYLVAFKPGATNNVEASARTLSQRFRAKKTHVYRSAVQGFAAEMSAADAARLAADPSVAYVEQDRRARKADVQTDPPWNIDRVDQATSTGDRSYSYPTAAVNTTAYLIDTGINITHQEFGHRARYGWNFADGTSNADDCDGHGTHVAGTLGGRTFGVAKDVQLVALRVSDCVGNLYGRDILAAIDWVTANAAKPAVVNLSLEFEGVISIIDNAVNASIASGLTYTVAAGNYDEDACLHSPASVRSAIVVGATDQTDARWEYSDRGSCVDVFAPGVEVRSAGIAYDTQTEVYDGTSMAAPHVAGAAALILTRDPGASPSDIQNRLIANATPGVVGNPGLGSPNRLLRVVPPAATTDRLPSGQALTLPDSSLVSPNGRFFLMLQSDGNVILYEKYERYLWATHFRGVRLVNQADGNLVLYRGDSSPAWYSGTQNQGASTLVLQNDGNLVLYRNIDNQPIWFSGTHGHANPPAQPTARTDRLSPGQGLVRGGATLVSGDGRFELVVQSGDGNLVLYQREVGAIWAAYTRNTSWLLNQPDGNLVMYPSRGPAIWHTGTNGNGASTLVLQNDGNLVLYRNSDNRAIWWSGSRG